MAKLKLLKMPKKPRLPKKPAQSASLSTKQSWLRRVKDLKAKWEAKTKAVASENQKRIKLNKESQRLSNVIAGIGDVVTVRPGSFKTSIVRKKRSSAVKKAKPRKKAAHKKAAKKSARRRR